MSSSPRSAAKLVFVLVVLALLVSAAAYAQNVGSVRGTVRSADGEPLPGVLVQATGDIVRGERTSMSGVNGDWLIPGLPPGLVTLTATLEGMETETVEGVRVSISGVAVVDFSMRVAGVEEAITVTSEAPILDVTSSSASSSFQAELIDAKPTTQRNFQELALMAPGVSANGQVGSVGVYSGFVSAYGRDEGSVAWNVDGLDISFPDTGNIWGAWADPDTIAEVQVLGVGAPAEYGNMTGAAVNVVTKSGTNTFQGRAAYTGEFDGLTSAGPQVEDAAGVERGFVRETYNSWTLSAGGPLRKDKLYFFAAVGLKEDLMLEPGATPSIDIPVSTFDHYNLKLDWSLNPSHTLTGAFQFEDYARSYGNSSRVITNPAAVGTEYVVVPYTRLGYQGILGSNTILELNWNDIHNKNRNVSATGSLEAPFIDFNTSPQTMSGGKTYPYMYPVWWNRGHAKVTHFAEDLAGSHEFKFGFQYSSSGEKAAAVYPGFSGKYYYKYGANYYVYSRKEHYYGADTEALGFYVDDSWRVNDRLTLNLGIRTDSDGGEIPPYPLLESYLCDELNCGVKTGEFSPRYPDVVDYSSVDPRLGLAYRIGDGDRQAVLRVSAGRYHEMNVVSNWQQPHPDRPVARFGYSPNRHGPFVYFSELGNGTFGLPRKDLKRPQTDQYAVGYERQIGEYVVGLQLIAHETTDMIGWQIADDGEYEDTPYVNPLTGETIMLKNMIVQPTLQKGNRPGNAANAPRGTKYHQKYKGAFLTFAKRHTGRWSLNASLGWAESKGFQPDALQESQNNAFYIGNQGSDPNHHLYGGELGQSDRPWTFRTQATFDLPWDLRLLTILNYEEGRPYRHMARVRLNQGNVTVPLEPMTGDRRMPARKQIDIGLSRRFTVGDRVGLNVDLQALNLLDDDGFYYWGSYGRYPAELVPSRYFLPRRMAIRLGIDF